jgi:hypothetical protein
VNLEQENESANSGRREQISRITGEKESQAALRENHERE